MEELEMETAKRAVSTIVQSIINTIVDCSDDLEKQYTSEELSRSFNLLFDMFGKLTTGKYGDQSIFIKSEVKRLIEKTNSKNFEDKNTYLDHITEVLGKEWIS